MNAPLAKVSLDDKFTLESGRVLISGTQAMVRAAMMQHARDSAAGLRTAGYISGYRGSPLGGLDLQLARAQSMLKTSDIVFEPGLNEDLAVTAVWGSQQANAMPGARYDGVFGMWYGKGPGVDRSGDALKHANNAGSSPHGGVLAVFGDDHPGKSSTLAHQSEQAMAAFNIPILYPATLQEYLDYALLGWAMSRYTGLWTAFKCVNETVESTATVDIDPQRVSIVLPEFEDATPHNIQLRYAPVDDDMVLVRQRLPRVRAFAAANGLDRITLGDERARIGIVTSGKAWLDVMQALASLGIDDERARALGIAVYKLGLVWPLDGESLSTFARGKTELVFVEEKRAFLEPQAAHALYHLPESERPRIVGKVAPDGEVLLPSDVQLETSQVARVIVSRMDACGIGDDSSRARAASLVQSAQDAAGTTGASLARTPFFCSGCPHNRSTKVPDGSIASSGIGCHGMAMLISEDTIPGPHMGAEGANWIGMSRFVEREHLFQNLGDGTYSHSGILAIRAAINAGVNITYKILYNDAVAMTGGQPVEGSLTVDQIARQVAAEGVRHIAVVSDEPDKYHRGYRFPEEANIHARTELDRIQREMRETEGVTAIIYDQTCAAEKRRRRKRGTFPNPARRAFINERVCEGCGDCSVKANCVSIQPLDTPLGRKRLIDQSSCNKDFSCIEGFCPSFVTVHGAEPKRAAKPELASGFAAGVPEPAQAGLDGTYNVLINGVGGTGVVTIGAVLGMAAHLESKTVSIYDMTGLSQKGGTVFSHLRLAQAGEAITGPRIGPASADLLLGCDLVVSGGKESLSACVPDVTRAVVNAHMTPTGAFQLNPDLALEVNPLESLLRQRLGAEYLHTVDASAIATTLLGDSIGANMFMVGYAVQLGLLPLSLHAIEEAVKLNNVAVQLNLDALALGRLAAHDPAACARLLSEATGSDAEEQAPASVDELLSERAAWLADYQNSAYAERYREAVTQVRDAESRLPGAPESLTRAVLRYLYKVMAYKDEYEVARLYTDGEFRKSLEAQFDGDYELSFHLAPPLFAKRDPSTGLPAKREYGSWMLGFMEVLAKLRFLRGTGFDLFGMTEERRRERAVRDQYLAMVRKLAGELTPENHAVAIELAEIPERIRGFGHVKLAHLERAEAAQGELEQKLAAVNSPEAARSGAHQSAMV